MKIIPITCIVLAACAAAPIIHASNALALSFGATTNLSNSANGDSSSPQVATVSDNIYVVWQDDESGIEEILFTRSTNRGLNYSQPISVSTTTSSSINPRLAASGNDVFVVWQEEGEIYITAGINNSTDFSEPINVSDTGNHSRFPQIANSGMHVYVAWEEVLTDTNTEIFLSVSNDAGSSFSDPLNLSNSVLLSSSAHLQSFDDLLYVVWKEFDDQNFIGDVIFALSADAGQTFSNTSNLSETLAGDAFSPEVAASGSNVVVIWGDVVNLETFVAVSTDSGDTFGTPINLSGSASVFAANHDLVISGANIYVVWQDEITGDPEVFIASIMDQGVSIGTPANISNSSGSVSLSPKVLVSGTNPETVYVLWHETNSVNVFLAVSTDSGDTFGTPINLSNTGSTGSSAFQMSVTMDRLHVVWADGSLGESEIFSRVMTDSGPPSLTIDSVSDETPRWDLDTVNISGTVNGNSTDTLTVEWGDGEFTSDIPVEGSIWGPIWKTYGLESTGPREVVVKLLDELGTVKASDIVEIQVQKHETNLNLDSIFSVVRGTDISITGQLTDIDADLPLSGTTINFTGTGAAPDLSPVITAVEGSFLSIGASPEIEGSLSVQAHFQGNNAYQAADSNIVEYDTVTNGTAEFIIPSGRPSGPIELTEFNASIIFDDVLSSGVIFVTQCVPSQSDRFVEIPEMCLNISQAFEMNDTASAHITLSYDELMIPDGYSEDQISLFHETISGIVDITESRDMVGNTVTGRTSDFSRFIGGIAIHDDAPVGAERLPILVGSNDLLFEFPEERQISFSDMEFNIGSTVTMVVADVYANFDDDQVDKLNVTLSSTSDVTGISIEFNETGLNTGTFEGVFTLTNDVSSPSESKLHAAPGDEISGFYEAFAAQPFRVIISGVIEAGLAEAAAAKIPAYLSISENYVDVYELRLIDARLGSDANVTIVLSYANFTGVSDPLQLGIATVDNIDCFDVISSNSTNGINTAEKTISGYTDIVARFALILDDHVPADRECFALGQPPGGGGGGLPRPGTGIILLDTASVGQEQTDNRNSGKGNSGSSSRSATITQTTPGEDMQLAIRTERGTVVVLFESVVDNDGQLKVVSNELSYFDELFDEVSFLYQDNDEHGIIRSDGRTFSTAGEVFDINASTVNFDGKITVTIPYHEEIVRSFSKSETEVKFLHYNSLLGIWEEKTARVDPIENVVTGVLDSLSPVVAAIVFGDTRDNSNFTSEDPLLRIRTMAPLITISEGDEMLASIELNSVHASDQDYVIIMQVVDANNIVQHIAWEAGSIEARQISDVSINWQRMEAGTYDLQVFILSDLDSPWLLSPAMKVQFII